MTIISGTNPSITCFSILDSKETQVISPSSTKYTIFSTIYSDIKCTNKIGISIEEIVDIVNNSNVTITQYNATFLFDKFGNINFQTCLILEAGESDFTDQIVFGTDNFLNSRGFKHTVHDISPDKNLHYIWIDGA
jgi:hypothetical protein